MGVQKRERVRVKALTAIKAKRRSWHKYLTLRGNLQHVMSRPWLGRTVTPSHITWVLVGGYWGRRGHVSVLHRPHIRGRTMLPLTLISIKPFLWNRAPHRSRLPTCLFPFSWHRRFTAGQLKCLCMWVSLCLMSDLLRAVWPIPREPLTMQPASFSSSSLIVSKMFFQPYVIVCRLSRVNPMWIIPALIG